MFGFRPEFLQVTYLITNPPIPEACRVDPGAQGRFRVSAAKCRPDDKEPQTLCDTLLLNLNLVPWMALLPSRETQRQAKQPREALFWVTIVPDNLVPSTPVLQVFDYGVLTNSFQAKQRQHKLIPSLLFRLSIIEMVRFADGLYGSRQLGSPVGKADQEPKGDGIEPATMLVSARAKARERREAVGYHSDGETVRGEAVRYP
ncbi:uncharacterized protein CLUP02_08862 [Colletotrichum lupini]|uniref:Uncharacterized protein n=1 Tax=Colletotrichum lupini TaxID=145971 RepID=A0A9Q8STN2_9PEZI|nr:uncharacterized protein CLUP02_08862 [Colletotrichum lupini]UQC83367.1 hypothetical protein CLUP02_08862 [Colletotrichum lupini]